MNKLENISVSNMTTIRIGGEAEFVYFPENPDELISLIYELREKKIPWSVLGGGSNVLISSKGVKGALICTTSMEWITKTSPETIVVGAGTRLPRLASHTSQLGLSGCEFYEGIPGTVGGAVIMNAGAHGHSTTDILEKVVLFDTKKLEMISLVPSQIAFGYRKSSIDTSRYIVLEAKYRLKQGTMAQIQNQMKFYSKERESKQPKGFSCGCIFRNPNPKYSAGKLIDEMGFKGYKIGGAEVSQKHANFILNAENANSENMCNIINTIQTQIWTGKHVWLQPEIQPLGEFSEEEKVIWLHPVKRRNNTETNSEELLKIVNS